MLQHAEVDSIPSMDLLPYSAAELGELPVSVLDLMAKVSSAMWTVSDGDELILTAGVVQPSLIGTYPELWLLIGNGLRKHLRSKLHELQDLTRQLLELYPTIRVRVELSFTQGHRFARILGFKPVAQSVHQVGTRTYVWYEV